MTPTFQKESTKNANFSGNEVNILKLFEISFISQI